MWYYLLRLLLLLRLLRLLILVLFLHHLSRLLVDLILVELPSVAPLELLALLGPSVLEPNLDLPLGQLELLGDLLFPWNRYVLVESELILKLYALCIVVNDTILVLGARLVLGHVDLDVRGCVSTCSQPNMFIPSLIGDSTAKSGNTFLVDCI